MIGDARSRVLIGFDEDARKTLVNSVIEDILTELRAWNIDRHEAVAELAQSLGPRLRLTEARTRERDHAKVYVFGQGLVVVGSSNLSLGGLRSNHESNTALRDEESVRFWTTAFDTRWDDPETVDITDELRERLLAWLRLRSPWEVYLRAAYLLLDVDPVKRPSSRFKQPTEYQHVVARRIVMQLKDPERRGAMLIASTGLGKTIMATAVAAQLHESRSIRQVVVFSPLHVKAEWHRSLNAARINHKVFTINTLFNGSGRGVHTMLDALEDLDGESLLIVDESHRLRRRLELAHRGKATRIRLPASRIENAVAKSGCKVLLLTATPLAADIEDVRNQLYLLPHLSHVPDQVGALRLFERYPWSIEAIEDLITSPVATILNTPFVAKHFAKRDLETNSEYIDFPDGSKRFLPKLGLYRVPVELPHQGKIADILDRRVLRHKPVAIRVGHVMRKADNLAERQATTAWASSPPELARTLRKVLSGDYGFSFLAPLEVLEDELLPLLSKLEAQSHREDSKFQSLRAVVALARREDQKVVVFAERIETLRYLEEGLSGEVGLRVASVIAPGGEALKPDTDIDRIIQNFAPLSNTVPGKPPPDNLYDVLLTTDALAEGINLQDASYLVSYDLAWTADVIVQRAGRIMRLWNEPRSVHIYAFVPDPQLATPPDAVSRMPEQRLKVLTDRLESSQKYTELPLLPDSDKSYEHLGGLSSIQLLVNDDMDPDIAFDPAFASTSEVLIDYTLLQDNRELAQQLGDDLLTARVVPGLRRSTLVSVVRHGDSISLLKYTDAGVEEIGDDELFGYLRCRQEDPRALVDAELVERKRHEAVTAWRNARRIPADEPVEHVCSAWLVAAEAVEEVFG